MSHFTVLVVGEDVEGQLAPYDEGLEVPVYTKATRDQLIAESKKHIKEQEEGNYAQYLADPIKYAEECKNPAHLEYFSSGKFAQKLGWTDEEHYADAIEWLTPEEISLTGGQLSTYNPDSKWDWWVVGGRWENRLIRKDGVGVNTTTAGELDLDKTLTFAILKDGLWFQRGEMLYWGIVADEKEEEIWRAQWKSLLENLEPNTPLTLIDAHI